MFKAEEKCNRSRRRTMRDYVKRAQDNPQLVMQRGVAVSPAMRFAAQATGYAQLGIEFQRVGLDCGVVFGYDPASDIPEELLIARVSRLAVARFCGPVAEWASLRFSADLYNSAREDREWAIAQKRALAHRGTVPESL